MNKSKVLEELKQLVSFRSLSADPNYANELHKAAQFLANKLLSLGFEIFIQEKQGIPPLIIAKKVVSTGYKTIAVYGHYDVQPEDPIEEWNTEPFTLSIQNGKLYGRGVADNKGHIVQNITAIEDLINTESLKANITFILEGEEETGSDHFEKLIDDSKNLLKDVDIFYITDTGMKAKNVPIIYYSLRGYVGFELTIHIGERDLHSGVYGNQVYNPVQLIAELFAKIKDSKTGKILIPGFNDSVRSFNQEELDILEKAGASDAEIIADTQVTTLVNHESHATHLLSKIYPACDIGGIHAGYTGVGLKNIIPKSATVKFSFRLVEYQDPQQIKQIVTDFISQHIPEGVEFKLKNFATDSPFYTEITNEYMQKTAKILSEHFGNETIFDREGASIPAAEILQRIFKKPIILTGFVIPGENMHAPNENFDEEMFWKGIEVLKRIYSEVV